MYEAQDRTKGISARISLFYQSLFIQRFKALSGTEDERDTPNARQSDHGIYDTASDRFLTAEYPCDNVKAEKTDATPVKSAYDGDYQGNSIHYHK